MVGWDRKRIGRCSLRMIRLGPFTRVVMIVAIVVVSMINRDVNMGATRVSVCFNNAGPGMRMRQHVPQHEHRDQQ